MMGYFWIVVFALVLLMHGCSSYMSWGYEEPNGPNRWPRQCQEQTHKQSPINIDTEEAKEHTRPLPPLTFTNYDKNARLATVYNTGHTARVLAEWKRSPPPTVSGGHLPEGSTFAFRELHFHWGETHHHGSEHRINNKQHSVEAHFVHVNEKYHSVEDALEHNAVVVLGVLFESKGKENRDYSPILSILPKITRAGNATHIKEFPTLRDLLPYDVSRFFYYNGSLTTPNCNIGVNWIVFEDHLHISEHQVHNFQLLYTEDLKMINKTYRPIQMRRGSNDVWYRSSAHINKPFLIHFFLLLAVWYSRKKYC